ncbi:hypothetical protein QR680_012092 [Steinernema hermaphroditum]|uniref:Neurotransmitter-gated ion-channel ligand-binding domain-containing protein n=1 Tax=Steinernema hermaphroditum TaxID=289476 RepID=A0AA39I3K0_9BILA|nr:hypothetical protein QR680_012092 [Steinernema hermaphroditum]
MEHTPFVFIESVIALFANLNACRKLSGYWGEAVLPERKTFKAVLDVYDGKILLKNTDRREMDCKEIRITARSYVMSSLEPPNKDDLIWALCNPVTTRLRQNLQLDNLWRTVGIYDGNDWRREDLLYPDEILDSIKVGGYDRRMISMVPKRIVFLQRSRVFFRMSVFGVFLVSLSLLITTGTSQLLKIGRFNESEPPPPSKLTTYENASSLLSTLLDDYDIRLRPGFGGWSPSSPRGA